MHPGFETHISRWLALLQCPDDRDAVAENHPPTMIAAELERGCGWRGGFLVVSLERQRSGIKVSKDALWAFVQSSRSLKLVNLNRCLYPRVGETPLAGIRVLDLTRVLAGPTCGRTLAQHGADVLKIGSRRLPDVPVFEIETGHGKRWASLDLKTTMGKFHLRRLVEQTDIFVQSYRSGALARLGFGPVSLAATKPGIIYTSINCYGHEGPWPDTTLVLSSWPKW